MKVNFNASYGQVSNWLQESRRLLHEGGSGQDFSQKLASLVQDKTQQTKNTQEITEIATPSTQALAYVEEPKARMFLPKLDFREPAVPFHPGAKEKEMEVNEMTKRVKTPTLVDAKRLFTEKAAEPQIKETPSVPYSERMEAAKTLISDAGKEHALDPHLALSIANAESAFDTHAVSKDGHESKGLFQLLDSTAQTVMEREGISFDYDPFNPKQNVDLGMNYLRYLHDVFSTNREVTENIASFEAKDADSLERLAVAAFNAGEGRVASAQQRAKNAGHNPADYAQVESFLPSSTQSYVDKVLSWRENYSKEINS